MSPDSSRVIGLLGPGHRKQAAKYRQGLCFDCWAPDCPGKKTGRLPLGSGPRRWAEPAARHHTDSPPRGELPPASSGYLLWKGCRTLIHQRIRLTQPGSFPLSIIRVRLPDKALFLPTAGQIPSPLMGEAQGEGGEAFTEAWDSVYDSFANPVNITAIAVHLWITCRP